MLCPRLGVGPWVFTLVSVPSSPGPGSGWKLERVVELELVLRQLLPGPAAAHAGVQRAFVRRSRVPGPLGGEQRLLPAAVPRSGPWQGPGHVAMGFWRDSGKWAVLGDSGMGMILRDSGMGQSWGAVGGGRSEGWGQSWETVGWGRSEGTLHMSHLVFCIKLTSAFSIMVSIPWLPAPTSWGPHGSVLPGPSCFPHPHGPVSLPCCGSWTCTPLTPMPVPPSVPGVPCSGREVADLGVVGRLQCHVWGWHAAPGAYLLGALLWGRSLPGPAGRVPPVQCPAVSR